MLCHYSTSSHTRETHDGCNIAMLIYAMIIVQAQAVSQVATEELPVPLGLSGSTLVDMWRMSKIFAVQSLLLVISRLLLTGLT